MERVILERTHAIVECVSNVAVFVSHIDRALQTLLMLGGDDEVRSRMRLQSRTLIGPLSRCPAAHGRIIGGSRLEESVVINQQCEVAITDWLMLLL